MSSPSFTGRLNLDIGSHKYPRGLLIGRNQAAAQIPASRLCFKAVSKKLRRCCGARSAFDVLSASKAAYARNRIIR